MRSTVGLPLIHRRVTYMVQRMQSRAIPQTEKLKKDVYQNVATNALPFEEIPEARGLPFIGTLLDYTKLRGFDTEYLFNLWIKRHQQLGDIYKEKPPGQPYWVLCRSREDTETMFRSDTRFPNRPSLDALTFSKVAAGLPDSFANISGEEWLRQRRVINGPLLMNKMVWKYVKEQQDVSKDFMKYIARNSDIKGEVDDFESALSLWGLEMAGAFMLDTKMGLLGTSPDPEMEELAGKQNLLMEFIADSITQINLWKFIRTKKSRELVSAVRRSHEIIGSIIERKQQSGELEGTVCGQILQAEVLTREEAISMVYDVLTGAIETTSNAAALMMYCLSRNPDAQEKLREEILSLPNEEELSGRTLGGMKYMNAFVKETIRIYPLSHGIGRIYPHDIVLSGYQIPAGTVVMNTSNSTQNNNPDYFPEPQEFIPERWMEVDDKAGRFNFIGPFGLGARSCPGRRFAMQEIRLLLLELLKVYRVEYHYKPMVSVFRATGCPSEEPRFRFIPLGNSP